MIKPLAGKDYTLQAGALVKKSEKVASAWVEAGIAEIVTSKGSSKGTSPSKRTAKATSQKAKKSTKR